MSSIDPTFKPPVCKVDSSGQFSQSITIYNHSTTRSFVYVMEGTVVGRAGTLSPQTEITNCATNTGAWINRVSIRPTQGNTPMIDGTVANVQWLKANEPGATSLYIVYHVGDTAIASGTGTTPVGA